MSKQLHGKLQSMVNDKKSYVFYILWKPAVEILETEVTITVGEKMWLVGPPCTVCKDVKGSLLSAILSHSNQRWKGAAFLKMAE